MGKSLKNYIGIGESPYEMMKKFMQLPDAVMRMYFELLTTIPMPEVEQLLAGHPKAAKQKLAESVIADYHPAEAAQEAVARWEREIGAGEGPAEIATVTIAAHEAPNGTVPAVKLLVLAGLCATTSDARRAIAQKGAYMGEDKTLIEAHDTPIPLQTGLLLWVGKKRVVRVEVT
jgi:tyrosyl-tRNA synthetase